MDRPKFSGIVTSFISPHSITVMVAIERQGSNLHTKKDLTTVVPPDPCHKAREKLRQQWSYQEDWKDKFLGRPGLQIPKGLKRLVSQTCDNVELPLNVALGNS